MSTSGNGLAKLMVPIEPCRRNAGSATVELLDQLLGGDHSVGRVDQFAHLTPVDLLPGCEVKPEPAGRSEVGGEEEPGVLLECPAVAFVDFDHERLRILDVV